MFIIKLLMYELYMIYEHNLKINRYTLFQYCWQSVNIRAYYNYKI